MGLNSRMASAAFMGRMDTTRSPANGPAGRFFTLVRYMATFFCSWMCRSGMPSCSSICSKEKEQPRAKVTKSGRQSASREVSSSARRPSR